MPPALPKPTLVLVHGAWHSSTTWNLLVPLLTAAGYPTATVDLPTAGCTKPTPMAEDVAVIRKTVGDLLDQGREVVVIAHSYGSAPATEAMVGLGKDERRANGLDGGVIKLIYIAGGVPTKGRAALDVLASSKPREEGGPWLVPKDLGNGFTIPTNGEEAFYNDLPEEEAKHHASLLLPQYSPAALEPITYEAYRVIPAAFIYCEDDRAFTLAQQKEAVQAAGIQQTVSLKTSHSPFLSDPEVVVAAVNEILGVGKE
ncbi:Alpha/beta hydrolase fold-1 [Aspergillus unguis]